MGRLAEHRYLGRWCRGVKGCASHSARNTQIATIIKVAASIAQTGEAGAQTRQNRSLAAVQAVSNAIVKQAVAAVAEEAATGVAVDRESRQRRSSLPV